MTRRLYRYLKIPALFVCLFAVSCRGQRRSESGPLDNSVVNVTAQHLVGTYEGYDDQALVYMLLKLDSGGSGWITWHLDSSTGNSGYSQPLRWSVTNTVVEILPSDVRTLGVFRGEVYGGLNTNGAAYAKALYLDHQEHHGRSRHVFVKSERLELARMLVIKMQDAEKQR